MSTLLYQIETCLNSRPLSPQSDDSDALLGLTPGHFLIGREVISPPDPVSAEINTNLLSRWRLMQKMKLDYWKI